MFDELRYLSEGFEGGETTFFPGNKKAAWMPEEFGLELKVGMIVK